MIDKDSPPVPGRAHRGCGQADGTRHRVPAGRCFVYVFACTWEDHCKIGFSRDPLRRMQELHHRYFEFFDLDDGWLVQTETEREARALELELHHMLADHSAPAPLGVRQAAAGHTEWFRGARTLLKTAIDDLGQRGFIIHGPLRAWTRHALEQRADLLFAWTSAQLSPDAIAPDWSPSGDHVPGQPWLAHPMPEQASGRASWSPAHQLVRDALDACVALEIDLQPWLPAAIAQWHRQLR